MTDKSIMRYAKIICDLEKKRNVAEKEGNSDLLYDFEDKIYKTMSEFMTVSKFNLDDALRLDEAVQKLLTN